MSGAFVRGSQAKNMLIKPMMRKGYHKKSSTSDQIREVIKQDMNEISSKSSSNEGGSGCCWVPDERTGIYYPKGQEKVMEGIPADACRDIGTVNWFTDCHHNSFL